MKPPSVFFISPLEASQSLEQQGLLVRKRIHGQKGYEYFPTESCKELLPLVEQAGHWGMRWARDQMTEDDFDLGLLLLYLERSINPAKLVGLTALTRNVERWLTPSIFAGIASARAIVEPV